MAPLSGVQKSRSMRRLGVVEKVYGRLDSPGAAKGDASVGSAVVGRVEILVCPGEGVRSTARSFRTKRDVVPRGGVDGLTSFVVVGAEEVA